MWFLCIQGKGQRSSGLHDLGKFTVQSLAGNAGLQFGFKSVHVCSLVELPHNSYFFSDCGMIGALTCLSSAHRRSCRQDLAEFRTFQMLLLKCQVLLAVDQRASVLWPVTSPLPEQAVLIHDVMGSAPLEKGYKSLGKGLGTQACNYVTLVSQRESQKHLNLRKWSNLHYVLMTSVVILCKQSWAPGSVIHGWSLLPCSSVLFLSGEAFNLSVKRTVFGFCWLQILPLAFASPVAVRRRTQIILCLTSDR